MQVLQDIDLPDMPTPYPNLDDTLPAAYEDCVTLDDGSDAAARVAVAVKALQGCFLAAEDRSQVFSISTAGRLCLCSDMRCASAGGCQKRLGCHERCWVGRRNRLYSCVTRAVRLQAVGKRTTSRRRESAGASWTSMTLTSWVRDFTLLHTVAHIEFPGRTVRQHTQHG